MNVVVGFSIVIAEYNTVESSIHAFGAADEELGVVLAFSDALSSPCGITILLPHHIWRRGTLPEAKLAEYVKPK